MTHRFGQSLVTSSLSMRAIAFGAFSILAAVFAAGCSEGASSSEARSVSDVSEQPAQVSGTQVSVAQASDEQRYVDVWGPKTGTQIPMLRANDQTGEAQTLATLSGAKGLLLLFSRSADW